jgi:hypothetical protein
LLFGLSKELCAVAQMKENKRKQKKRKEKKRKEEKRAPPERKSLLSLRGLSRCAPMVRYLLPSPHRRPRFFAVPIASKARSIGDFLNISFFHASTGQTPHTDYRRFLNLSVSPPPLGMFCKSFLNLFFPR